MTADEFDAFLDEATHNVCNLWEEANSFIMSTNDLCALNDLLTTFFNCRR